MCGSTVFGDSRDVQLAVGDLGAFNKLVVHHRKIVDPHPDLSNNATWKLLQMIIYRSGFTGDLILEVGIVWTKTLHKNPRHQGVRIPRMP